MSRASQAEQENGAGARLGYGIKRVEQRLMAAKAKALREFGLTVPQYVALMALREIPDQSAAQLARLRPAGSLQARRLKVPPAMLFAGAAGLQWAMAPRRYSPGRLCDRLLFRGAAAIACASGVLALAGAREFARHRTTVDPRHVDAASALVVTGPNARTRNPMYVGMLGCLLAHALARGSLAASLPAAGFWWVIDRCQIPDEEQALLESFGDAYDAYRTRVPRWL